MGSPPDPRRLLQLLEAGDLDGAIDAGLMDHPARGDDPADAPLLAAQRRLREAWAARDRHRARNARLAHIAAEREARRAPAHAPAGAPALPPAAAAALARARARAAGRSS